MLVDKDDEQKCCMSRRTTKAYCLYGEEVQRRQTVFMPLDLSAVVLGVGIIFVAENWYSPNNPASRQLQPTP